MMTEPTIESGEPRAKPAATRRVTELTISGMTCNNCARHVTDALQGGAGVQSANVNLDAGQASVRWMTE